MIKSIGEDGQPLVEYQQKNYTDVSPEHFEIAVEAMSDVIKHGTGMRANLPDIEVCGKNWNR